LAAPSRLGQSRVIQTNSARSLPHSRRQGGVRLKAMTKKQVLGFQPAPRLEDVDDEHSE
jgi:hypothetical protein